MTTTTQDRILEEIRTAIESTLDDNGHALVLAIDKNYANTGIMGAMRSTDRRPQAIPVENSGSTKANACGSINHRSPAARVRRCWISGRNAIGNVGCASRKLAAIGG